jgi:transcriptional regulator with XRE-family HTH domain
MVLKFESKDGDNSDKIAIQSEAFNDTLETFKISISDLARDSGVSVETIAKFRRGKKSNMTTRTLSRLLLALTPTQSAFYSATVQLLYAAKNANIEVGEMRFRDIVDITDIYRQAYQLVLDKFAIVQEHFAKKIHIQAPNLGAWKSGRRDFREENMDRVIEGFTIDQRTFYLALVEILFIVGSDKMGGIRKSAG